MIACLVVMQACKKVTPTPKQVFPQTYTSAYEEIYGHCYDSVPYGVVALDLYSEGIELDKDHIIRGTGYNLYLSDIFVPDSLLAEGTYRSDGSAQPFTFLPGRDYEGTPHGMYILYIEQDKIMTIHVLDSGSFTFRDGNLDFKLYYRDSEGKTSTYEPTFRGTLIPWAKQ